MAGIGSIGDGETPQRCLFVNGRVRSCCAASEEKMIEFRIKCERRSLNIVITFAATHHPFKLTVEVS
jgi:hypothetical protein